ncbi:MAG: AsmA-like C-terminal region-containing protein [Phycisphaerae bacterium]
MRKPKRKWRIRALATLVVLMTLAGAAQLYLTQPTRIQAQLQSLLASLDVGEVRVGYSNFSIFSGLRLVNLEVFASSGGPREPMLRVADAAIGFDLLSLLTGSFRPTDARLTGVQVRIERDERGGLNWRLAKIDPRADSQQKTSGWPRLRVEQADIQLFAVVGGTAHLQRRWIASADGQHATPTSDDATTYRLRLAQIGGSAARRPARDARDSLVGLEFSPNGVVATSGWVDVANVLSFLDAPLAESLIDARLGGVVALDRAVLEHGRVRACRLRFANGALSVPIESPESGVTPGARCMQLSDAEAIVDCEFGSSPTDAAHVSLNLQAATLGGTLDLAARADGQREALVAVDPDRLAYDISVRLNRAAFPDLLLGAPFYDAPRMPEPLRSFVHDYSPRGNFTLSLRATRKEGESEPRVEGEFEPLSASCRYKRFLYDLNDVTGKVRITPERIYLEGLSGWHGSSRVTAEGWCVDSSDWTGFELDFMGDPLRLDDDLYAAIPASYQALWREAQPQGQSRAAVRITRPHGSRQSGALDPIVDIVAHLQSAELNIGDERLREADGVVRITDNGVEIEDLVGAFREGTLQLDGTIELPECGAAPMAMRVLGARVGVERASQIVDSHGEALGTVQFAGIGDVSGHVIRGADGISRSSYVLQVRDGALSGFDPQRPFTNVSAWVAVDGDRARLLNCSARADDAWIQLSGDIPGGAAPGEALSLDIATGAGDVARLLPRVMPQYWRELREALGLSGAGEVAARLSPMPDRNRQRIELRVSAANMQPKPFPLPLTNVRAEIAVSGDAYEIARATAEYGDSSTVSCRGRGGWSPSNWIELSGEASGLPLSDALVAALPSPLGGLLARMKPRGRVDLRLARVRYDEGGAEPWQFVGNIAFRAADLRLGVPLSDFDGALDGQCVVDRAGAAKLEADFSVSRGALAGRPLSGLTGRLRRGAGDRWTRLDDLHGRFCDGEAVGSLGIDVESGEYEMSLTLSGLSLAQFLRRDDAGAVGRGRLDGRVFLRGRGDEMSSCVGGGDVRVRGVTLVSDPVMRALAAAGRGASQKFAEQLDQAELRFTWRGTTLHFDRVELLVGDARMVGEGSWDLESDEMDMTLVGAGPRAGRIIGVSELLEAAQSELVQYRVQGPARSPRVTAQPLHTITEPIRQMFRR